MKKLFLLLLIPATYFLNLSAQDFEIHSPDNRIVLQISKKGNFTFNLQYEGKTAIEKLETGMQLLPERNTQNAQITSHRTATVTGTIYPEIPYKKAQIIDHFHAIYLQTDDGFELEVRLYNDGFAYRYTDFLDVSQYVLNERLDLKFPANSKSYFPQEESTYSHNERSYLYVSIDSLQNDAICSLPVLFETDQGIKTLLTETALHDYPNLFIKKNATTLSALFPPYVLQTALKGDRNEDITETADYIATAGPARSYPWRVFIVSDEDQTFIASTLSYKLAESCELTATEWIKPGKVAWDWYNDNNIFGVDFKAGLNTDTYQYYIDFAAENGIEYVIFDEGWTKTTTEILDFNPDMDVPYLIDYANSKNIGIILWVLWRPLHHDMENILSTYQSWGAKGVKVDFMQRSDQLMVNSYEAIAATAARYELLVDFHGSFKPAGLQRKYPNVVNFEGVKGGENNKWSHQVTPTHNLTIPFIRMAAGPMDYTPGAMLNYGQDDHPISWSRPASLGTRCHQLAMYVIYEAPLQMLCDSPSLYKKEQESLSFITAIPTTWDETLVLEAAIGNYLVLARRKGNDWYIGAMTDWEARSFTIATDFLTGSYEAIIMQDGVNADRYPQDYQRINKTITQGDKLHMDMKAGGGFAAILRKQ